MANNKFIRNIKIEADAQGALPKTIQLLHVGSWNTPWHGDFEITEGDIDSFVENARNGVGLPEDHDGKIQINYSHKSHEKAAGWLTNLRGEYVDSVYSLVGDPTWTPAAQQALADGEYRYISPEFNPRALPWEDPEEEWRMVANVITGAALTNIPLFKKLKKVAASERPEPTSSAPESNKSKEGESMGFKLKDLRNKKASEINADERSFLEDNKAELTAEELTALDIKADEKPAPKAVEADTQEQVTITASELADLKASAARGVEAAQILAQKEASDFANERFRSGQIKSDQQDALAEILLASSGDQRKALETFLKALPVNERLSAASKVQGDGGGDATKTASEELHDKALEAIKADASLRYSDAVKKVLADNSELKTRIKAER